MAKLADENISWFRVLSNAPFDHPGDIVCQDCLVQFKLQVLNRVFGASQTCAKCGVTDKKEG